MGAPLMRARAELSPSIRSVVAAIPGRVASRTRPANVLRAE
jgi:hypothetical protein